MNETDPERRQRWVVWNEQSPHYSGMKAESDALETELATDERAARARLNAAIERVEKRHRQEMERAEKYHRRRMANLQRRGLKVGAMRVEMV